MDVISKKAIRDYIYNLETLDDIKSISEIAEGEFREAMNIQNPEALGALSGEKQPTKNEDEEEPSINHGDSKFKKLFRKAVIKCHPDKYTSEEYTEKMKVSYEMLSEANDTYDWGLLLKACLDLDVEVKELGPKEIENITEKTNDLKKSIQKYENSMAYSWYNISDETQKEKYLAECAKIFNNFLGN